MRPLERFLHVQAASGLLLLAAAAVALAWANSPYHASYEHLWHTPVTIGLGDWVFRESLHFVINEGLMVVFFFVVGLEIRREMHHGELSELKRAALPVFAAIGGMIAPALLYVALNRELPARDGWGVPTATDIAFAVGVLALLGNRVPAAIRVLLLALAIIDDIGAIIVIAIFYSSGISLAGLLLAALGVAGVFALRIFGVRPPLAYVVPGAVLWAGLLKAGVHPTIGGVVLGLLTPVSPWFGRAGFVEVMENALREIRKRATEDDSDTPSLRRSLARIALARREVIAPLVRLEAALHPWVAYGIMPLFALANAGVRVGGVDLASPVSIRIVLGVAFGLVLGKPLGILAASYIAVRARIAALPYGVTWRGVLLVGIVAGIGFTMAIFIAGLAFPDATNLGAAKLGVLLASAVASALGLAGGRALLRTTLAPDVAAITVDEAEASTER